MSVRVYAVRWAVTALVVGAGLTLQACDGDDPVGGNPIAPSNPSTQFVVEPSEATILVGETLQLRLAGTSAQGGLALPAEWRTSNPLVALISPEGVVTGVGQGTVEIAVAQAGFHASARVSVAARYQTGSVPTRRRIQPF